MSASRTLSEDKKVICRVVAALSDGRDRCDIAREAAILLDEKYGMNMQTSAHWNDFFCCALDTYATE